MAWSSYRLWNSNSTTIVPESAQSGKSIIHLNVTKAINGGLQSAEFGLAGSFYVVVVRALRCAEWSNCELSRLSQNFGVHEEVYRLVEVFDATWRAQQIVFRDVAFRLCHYRSDKGFGYALGIDVALARCHY